MTGSGFGWGKIVILGEHAVVHGQPAVVAGLDRGVDVTVNPSAEPGVVIRLVEQKRRLCLPDASDLGQAAETLLRGFSGLPSNLCVEVRSAIPPSTGLGSSAALAVGMIRALESMQEETWNEAQVVALANRAEGAFHLQPSGMDAYAAVRGTVFCYRKGVPPRELTPPEKLQLVVCQVQKAPPTREMVMGLQTRLKSHPQWYTPLIERIGRLAAEGADALEAAQWDRLGELMVYNHSLLRELGISTPRLDRFCDHALVAGAGGAKLTGGGGGGSIIALGLGKEEEIASALREKGALSVFITTIGG